jgi:hypothetical protein
MNEYENTRRITYGEGMTFVPVCEKCGRFVKAYKAVKRDINGQPVGNNAVCKKHGRTKMIFEGYY